ncbi:MAG: class I SAM-dependent methyltransferase [Limnochordales bacterium]|nr:class I SAM-dependent methyltransferase [Limnochordales bacterium]
MEKETPAAPAAPPFANSYYNWPDLYEATSPGVPGDISFYQAQATRTGGPVLEIGSGLGRISFALARAGLSVVGLEYHSAMLQEAEFRRRSQPQLRGQVQFIQGDMRNFSLGQQFPLIIMPYRTFLHCLTQEEQLATLACVREHLLPGGRFIFDFFLPDHQLIASEDTSYHLRGRYLHPRTGRPFLLWEATEVDRLEQRVDDHLFFELLDENGQPAQRIYSSFSIRYLFPSECTLLLRLAGFEVLQVFGGFHHEPLTEMSTDSVWIARRR